MPKNNKLARKPSHTTEECKEMLREAAAYIAENSPKQAEIMVKRFDKIVGLLEILPEMGTIYKNGMRKFKLGKFRYNIYYRVKKASIEIVGIWHTSRGTDFMEQEETAFLLS
jgi:plasmid stabilization system protein ParE